MAKLARVFHRVFGSSPGPTDMGQFGSFTAGAPTYSNDPATIMSLPSWLTGWLAAVVSGSSGTSDPFLEDENAVDFVHSRQIGYLLQAGIAEYEPLTTYYTGSFCTYQSLPYVSIADNNTGNLPPASPAFWSPYDSTRTGVILPFSGIVVPAGYGLCDGGAISRATYAALFNANTLQTPGNTVNGSNIISGIGTTANMQAGWNVSGPGIPAGALVLSIDSGSQIHISNAAGAALNATATANGVQIVVSPHGLGDGATTFNRPDRRGRVSIGAGAGAGLTTRIQGQKGGEETHVLTVPEMPGHAHPLTDPTHHHSYHMDSSSNGGQNYAGSAFGGGAVQTGTTDNSGTGITMANTGGDGAHNNMQPWAVDQWIVKY